MQRGEVCWKRGNDDEVGKGKCKNEVGWEKGTKEEGGLLKDGLRKGADRLTD